MTETERELLKTSVDDVVALRIGGETVLAQVLFVFDDGATPDVFYIEMKRTADGSLLPIGQHGHSTLLAEIDAVRPVTEP